VQKFVPELVAAFKAAAECLGHNAFITSPVFAQQQT
jgi:hypothetical protein